MKKILIVIVVLLNCFIVSSLFSQVSAAFSFQINQISPDTITSKDDEITINLSITDLPGESYFRVAFQKSDGANYFGYMKNDLDEWIKSNDDCKKFYHITDKATTHLEIPLKVGESVIESDIYNIKAHRYTPSCSSPATGLNSFQVQIIFPDPTPTPSPIPTTSPTPTSYEKIYISEAMVNPESGNNEWVEIYNNNDHSVSLTNWFLDDLENAGSSPKTFSLEVPAKSYKVFNLSSSMFNNDGDSVRLLDFNKTLKDDFEYSSSTQGKTFGRTSIDNDDFCLQESSYELTNNPCLNPTEYPTPTPSPIKTLAPTKTVIVTIKPTKPTNYNVSIHHNSISQPGNTNQGDVLGINTNISNNNFLLIRLLSSISFSYSFLAIVAVLIKSKIFKKCILAS